jgi:hypothetical protein
MDAVLQVLKDEKPWDNTEERTGIYVDRSRHHAYVETDRTDLQMDWETHHVENTLEYCPGKCSNDQTEGNDENKETTIARIQLHLPRYCTGRACTVKPIQPETGQLLPVDNDPASG